MGHERRIVVDFDDTISTTLDRDWDNALPIQPTIDKINELYAMGWEVCIATARGQLSCDGDSAAADAKYRPQMEAWLSRMGCSYTSISFEKKLAAYYIDDKALRPDEFSRLEVKLLKSGMSGMVVEKRGDRVVKTGARVPAEAAWYDIVGERLPGIIPAVHSLVGETITMDYVEHEQPRIYTASDVRQLVSLATQISGVSKNLDGTADTLVAKIDSVLGSEGVPLDLAEKLGDLGREALSRAREAGIDGGTFSHGDFSLDNVLHSSRGLVVIDPIFGSGGYSHWVYDVAKMLHSLRRKSYHDLVCYIYNNLDSFGIGVPAWAVFPLEIIHWVRVLPYLPECHERARFQTWLEKTTETRFEDHTAKYS